MSVVARFSIPAEQFLLGDVLEVREGIQVRLESMIPTGDSLIPYLWVHTDDADAVEAALQHSPMVGTVRRVDEAGTETLFRIEWTTELNGLVDVIRDSDAVLLEAEGLGDNWSFRLRFPDRETVSEFYRTCFDRGLTLQLDELNDRFGATRDAGSDLTEAQRTALLTAFETGYFSVPRQITLQELADQLDISDTALSQRLRRGLKSLLASNPPGGPIEKRNDRTRRE